MVNNESEEKVENNDTKPMNSFSSLNSFIRAVANVFRKAEYPIPTQIFSGISGRQIVSKAPIRLEEASI